MSDYCQTDCEHPECIAHRTRMVEARDVDRRLRKVMVKPVLPEGKRARVVDSSPPNHDDMVSRICLEHFHGPVSSADSDAAFMTHVVEPVARHVEGQVSMDGKILGRGRFDWKERR